MIKLLTALLLITSCSLLNAQVSYQKVDADNPNIHYIGRIDDSDPKALKFGYPGISIFFSFEGRVCNIRMKDISGGNDDYGKPMHNYYDVIIDGKEPFVIECKQDKDLYKIDSLSHSFHTIKIFKRTEALVGETVFMGFEIEKGALVHSLFVDKKKVKMEFIGNSITCGYGNEGTGKDCKFSPDTENNYKAFGSFAARKMDAEYVTVAYSGKGVIQNYDNSKEETMVDLYPRTLPHDKNSKWNFKKWSPDYVIMLLGANDFAHSVPDSAEFVNKYVNFVKSVHVNYPHAHFICCLYPEKKEGADKKKNDAMLNYLTAIMAQLKHHGVHKSHLLKFKTVIEDWGCDWHYGVKTHEKMGDELVVFIKDEIINKYSKLLDE